MRQVFASLFINAQEALRRQTNERRLSVRSRFVGATVAVEFPDNGPGIPQGVAARPYSAAEVKALLDRFAP